MGANRKAAQAGAALLALGWAGAAQAQAIDPDPKFWFEAGAYLPEAETDVSLSLPAQNAGTTISLENDLDFETSANSLDLTVGAKLDDDFFAELSLFDIDRTTSATIDRTITVEDATYDVGARVRSRFGSDIVRASVGYRLVAKDTWDLALLAGAHVTRFAFLIEGDAAVNGETATAVRRANDVLAPLPTLGAQAQFRPVKWLQLRARADYFRLAIDKYDGRLVNLEASATVALTRRLGLGAAWRSTEYRLIVDDAEDSVRVTYLLDGLRLFARLAF
jgi:hypothetical protein